MSTRWFFSSARHGAAAGLSTGSSLKTKVVFTRQMGGGPSTIDAPGPDMQLAGPGHVAGIDRSLILREEPPPGTPDAAENILASVEFAYADLPWLLPTTPPEGNASKLYPWLVLVVLSDEEAAPPRDADPLPILTAPHAALPPLQESWAWAHVEARLDDTAQDIGTATKAATDRIRARSAATVERLLCPRRLAPHTMWIAAVVPATAGGVSAGLGRPVTAAPGLMAWPPTDGGVTVDLPVYHWWTFHTGDEGDFELLARRLKFTKATDLGLGSRTIDVSQPWPAEPPTDPATVALDGALRAPGDPDDEQWSDEGLQQSFRAKLTDRLNAPADHRDTVVPASDGPENGGAAPAPDRDITAVGPPLYGSHHSGAQKVPTDEASWITTLNLEVRRRVAAALGTRYVQLEQEFLMARAWEQVGAIREANRMLAAAELSAVTAEHSRRKHIEPLGAADLVTTMAPLAARVVLPAEFARPQPGVAAPTEPATLADVLAGSDVPDGLPTTAFSRLARPGGGVRRRVDRATAGATNTASVIEANLPQGLPDALRQRTTPVPLQLRRIANLVAAHDITTRGGEELRPLRPIMAHPQFDVAIGQEILARWPDWALPGIDGLPMNSVTILETNPAFVAALLVGLNQEFNRELLWREFPTDQRGTPSRGSGRHPGPTSTRSLAGTTLGTWPTGSMRAVREAWCC